MPNPSRTTHLPLLLLAAALLGNAGCQNVPEKGVEPPWQEGETQDKPLASMGNTVLSIQQARLYLQGLDDVRKRPAALQSSELERHIGDATLRQYIGALATQEGYQSRPEIALQMDLAHEEALSTAYLEVRSAPQPDYPDAETLTKAYENNKERYLIEARVHLQQIFISDPKLGNGGDDGQAEVRIDALTRKLRTLLERVDEVEALAVKLREGELDFGATARARSNDAESAARDGDLGWITLSRLSPEIQQALAGAAQGSVVGPVRSERGWHILKVLEVEPASFQPLDEVAPALRESLREQQRQENRQRYIKALTSAHPIIIESERLLAYLKLSPVQKNQQGRKLLSQPIVAMGGQRIRLDKVMAALRTQDETTTRQLLTDTNRLQQFLGNLGLQRYIVKEAVDAGFHEQPEVINRMKQVRAGALYEAYLRSKTTPSGNFPGAALLQQYYEQNREQYALKVPGHQTVRYMSLEEVRPALVAALRQQKRRENKQQWIEQLTAREPIRIDAGALAQLKQALAQ